MELSRLAGDTELSLFQDHLARGNQLRFRPKGGSMWPSIRSGDIVHVTPADQFSVDDILLYTRGESWFVHRLIRIEASAGSQPRLILRGDALTSADPPIQQTAVLGRVFMIERGSRRIPVDSLFNKTSNVLCRTFRVRYIVLPWLYRYISRGKRLLKQLIRQ